MDIAKRLVGNEEERAVSPVIGVILMVAITVILAAVIAAFVLDLGQSQNSNVNAGVNFDGSDSSGNVTVQLTEMGNADYVRVQGDNGTANDTGSKEVELRSVGDSETMNKSSPYSDTAEVTVIAVDGDNENVVNNYPN